MRYKFPYVFVDEQQDTNPIQYEIIKLAFDFKDVTFIDSTGIGFILARYNQVNAYKGELILKNVTPFVRKILAISGIFQIMKVENDDLRNGVLR